jgi:glucose-6-phosphate isomerase
MVNDVRLFNCSGRVLLLAVLLVFQGRLLLIDGFIIPTTTTTPTTSSSSGSQCHRHPSLLRVSSQLETKGDKSAEEDDYLLQTEDYSILRRTNDYATAGDDPSNSNNNNNNSRLQELMLEHEQAAQGRILLPHQQRQADLLEWKRVGFRGVGGTGANVYERSGTVGEIIERRSTNKDGDDAMIMHDENETDVPWHSAVARGFVRSPVSKLWKSITNRPRLISTFPEWKKLQKHAEHVQSLHLRDLLQDKARSDNLYATHDGVYLDYSRQQVTEATMKFLFELAERQQLATKIQAMVTGSKINFTERRAVLHTALRAPRNETLTVDGMDVIAQVHEVLDQIKEFTNGVRSGDIRGYTGKRLRNIVSVGIGGSYLGPEFLHECLKTEPEGIHNALGYSLRFLSNVDPVDVERTCADLDPEETLIVIVSKTFTTAETMLNARTMRQWLWDFMGNDKDVVRHHMVACASTSAMAEVERFGIDRLFRFWDFVGGRYSVCSAAGAVPISLLYGFDLFKKFLAGARSMDKHFTSAPLERNIPVLMGLLGVWNMSFLKYQSRTTLPYAEALLKLPAHIQQLDMESNGKFMTKQGLEVDYPVGEIDFGEAGTNGQHSFYQLLHMGQTVPSEFIGFAQSQHDFCLDGESLSSHDELMANFFAQPDALATGKTADEVRAEGVPEDLIPHKVFKGNKPSLSLLLPKLTAYACGQLLALYEHRTAVQGFIWDINSFDQWGVELGKKLAIEVKDHFLEARQKAAAGEDFTVKAKNASGSFSATKARSERRAGSTLISLPSTSIAAICLLIIPLIEIFIFVPSLHLLLLPTSPDKQIQTTTTSRSCSLLRSPSLLRENHTLDKHHYCQRLDTNKLLPTIARYGSVCCYR